ncbi:ArsR family transcriptional regulator, partial [Mesorhizobium sp. M7A.F.Ca.CA.004.05.1.1]
HMRVFLTQEFQRMRLGFSDRQIADWFSEAGLDLEDSQEFEPRGGNEARLTVKLWLGRDRRLLIADPSNDTRQIRETA